MAKGKRTAYWKVVFCEDVPIRAKYGPTLERVETVLVDETRVVEKSTFMEEVRKMADSHTDFVAEGDWELATNTWRSYVKFDSDFYDRTKTSYMKILCGWVIEDEPLDMEWVNSRTHKSKKLREVAERLESIAKTIDEMDDMTCFDRELSLKALHTMLEMPEMYVNDVKVSLAKDIERKDKIESKEIMAA